MLFFHLKTIAKKSLEDLFSDCVIGIPSYFTDLQCRAYIDAATIVDLKLLRLLHDCTGTTATWVSEWPTSNLGGRDFDEVLFEHFAKHFVEQYKIDVHSNICASIGLRAACEKLKKILCANSEMPLSIERLMDEKDVKGFITRDEFEKFITRDEFEKLSAQLLNRLLEPCKKALEHANLNPEHIAAVGLCHRDGTLKQMVAKDPGSYINEDLAIVPLLKMLRDSGRATFIVTNSLWGNTNVVVNYLCRSHAHANGSACSYECFVSADVESTWHLHQMICLQLSGSFMEVGAQTGPELKEKKLRVEDALNAIKAAIEKGIVVGGSRFF